MRVLLPGTPGMGALRHSRLRGYSWVNYPIAIVRRILLLLPEAVMIPFIQLRRTWGRTPEAQSLKPVIVALILGLILLFQVGLVLWVFVKQW